MPPGGVACRETPSKETFRQNSDCVAEKPHGEAEYPVNISPITLSGRHVELRPLSLEDVTALCAVGLDEDLWRWIPTQVRNRDEMELYVRTALTEQREGRALPFVILALPDRDVAGSTRYANIDHPNRHLEIGWTWVARPWRRTAVNTEAKLLLLTHAFETLGCERVEFKTDRLNEQSRAALLRIGATEEGVFRHHVLTQSGRWRDSVYFSILAQDWPSVREALERKVRV